ncbi:MAG TPA: hypothetical protein VMT08_19935 [Bradyrhizobium sp.]|nr:hypothetical protein [Bradyrhizobium sp.]
MAVQNMSVDYNQLPLDPEEAFLRLEARYREECEIGVRNSGEHDNVGIYYTDYIAQVLGAAEELDLVEAAFDREIPSIQDVDFQTYQNFSKRVKHYTTRLEIRHGRRVQGHSVSFDATAKAKLHHLLSRVREIFSKLEVDERKREALLSKLSDLENEVDRNRTRFDAYAALAIEVADVSGEVVDRSKILDVLDAVARLFGVAKKEEATKQLPRPTKPKQIEHKRPDFGSAKPSEMDDDIPF